MTSFMSETGTVGTAAATGVNGASTGLVVAHPANAQAASNRNGRNMGDLVGKQELAGGVADPVGARKR